jgi:hypothetical protein
MVCELLKKKKEDKFVGHGKRMNQSVKENL